MTSVSNINATALMQRHAHVRHDDNANMKIIMSMLGALVLASNVQGYGAQQESKYAILKVNGFIDMQIPTRKIAQSIKAECDALLNITNDISFFQASDEQTIPCMVINESVEYVRCISDTLIDKVSRDHQGIEYEKYKSELRKDAVCEANVLSGTFDSNHHCLYSNTTAIARTRFLHNHSDAKPYFQSHIKAAEQIEKIRIRWQCAQKRHIPQRPQNQFYQR